MALKTNNTYEFLSIDGTSPCIYDAWRQRKFELTHDEQVKDYFKFFCWAIASTEGQFLMVDDYRMLPLTGKPQEISFSELRDLKYDITLDETSSVNSWGITRKANDVVVVYANSIFKVNITVNTS